MLALIEGSRPNAALELLNPQSRQVTEAVLIVSGPAEWMLRTALEGS